MGVARHGSEADSAGGGGSSPPEEDGWRDCSGSSGQAARCSRSKAGTNTIAGMRMQCSWARNTTVLAPEHCNDSQQQSRAKRRAAGACVRADCVQLERAGWETPGFSTSSMTQHVPCLWAHRLGHGQRLPGRRSALEQRGQLAAAQTRDARFAVPGTGHQMGPQQIRAGLHRAASYQLQVAPDQSVVASASL